MEGIEAMLTEARGCDARAVLITAGDRPAMRIGRRWVRLAREPARQVEVERMVMTLIPPQRWGEFQTRGVLEFEQRAGEAGMVHCRLHYRRGSLAALVRFLGAPAC